MRGSAFIWSPLLETSSEVQKCGIMGIQDWLPTLYAAAGMILFLIFRNSKDVLSFFGEVLSMILSFLSSKIKLYQTSY